MGQIDVVIPAHEKDYRVLPLAVRSVLWHVPELRRVWVVSRQRFNWPTPRVCWIPEPAEPLPTLQAVEDRLSAGHSGANGRASWVYQQLLKLGVRDYIPEVTPQYLVVDADVVFLRHVWFELSPARRFVYPVAGEHHEPYRHAYERLLGRPPPVDYSMVAHHMLFDRELVAEMCAEIEQRHGNPWFEAYLDAVDNSEASSISEMDTYGWWVLERHPELAFRRQMFWRDVPRVPGILSRARYAEGYSFVAAHAWSRRSRRTLIWVALRQLGAETRAALRPARRW